MTTTSPASPAAPDPTGVEPLAPSRPRDLTLADLTPEQQRTLASMRSIQSARGSVAADWLEDGTISHAESLESLEALGVVEYDRHLGRARTRPAQFWIVSLCHRAVEHGACRACGGPLTPRCDRGWTDDVTLHYDCARKIHGDEFRSSRGVVTVECGKPGQERTLTRSGISTIVHLAGTGRSGGTGACLCGFDRFAENVGFNVGGGTQGSGVTHEVCSECARLAGVYAAPVRGLHSALFTPAANPKGH